MADFQQLARACLSPENGIREQAEQRLQSLRKGEANTYLSHLCNVVANSSDLQARMFLCVMLRQDVGPRSPVWNSCSPKAKDAVKVMLLGLLKDEKNRIIRKHVCQAAGRLASHTVAKGTWKSLLPALDQMCKSPHSLHLESSLHIAGILSENASNAMKPLFPTLHKVILKALGSKDSSLQVAALRATESFIVSLEGHAQATFIKLLPKLFEVAAQLAQKADDEPLQDYIDEIASLVTFRCQMFRPMMANIIKLMANIAGHKDLEPGTRRMALSLVVELAKRDRTSVKQVKEMTSEIIPLAYSFMERVDEDMNKWSQGTEEKDDDDEDFCMGWDTLDNLATNLGGGSVLNAAWPLIQKALSSKSWLHRHAAISAVSALTPGCQKVMAEKLGNLLSMVAKLAASKDEHVRVRWAAVNCIGRFCVLFSDEIHERFALPTLQCLVGGINSRDHVRLAASAALCIVDYCRGMEAEQLQPRAEAVLGALRKLLGVNARLAQTAALSAVSAVASTIETGFQKYYGAFMPGVMKLLTESKGGGSEKLKSKAIECVGAIAAAVGPEQFRPQFKPTMEFLLKTQGRNLGADDPQINAILECCARICQCMGKEFIPYIRMVVPPLLKAAASKDGAFMQDGDDDVTDKEGYETVDFAVRGVGNKRLVVNSAMLQEKAMACHMLYQYASELKEGFYPYVTQTAKIMVPLIKYRYHESVRVAAVDSIPPLLECLKLRGEINKLKELFNFALLPYLQAIMLEGDVSSLIGILHSFSDAIDVLPGPMDAKAINETHQALGFVLSESNRRRAERFQEYKNADDEIKEEIEEENEQEDEMIGYVGSVIKSIVDLSKAQYLDLFNGIMHRLMWQYLAPDCSDGQHTAALIAYCNIIEQGGAAAGKYAGKFLPVCVCYAGNTNTNVRQASVYGIGVCALSLGEKGFAKYCNGSLKTLVQVINSKSSRDDKFGESTDNAISSVGKICKIQTRANPAIVKEILPMWLSWLPCTHDEEEGPIVHSMLLDFLEDMNSPIYGKGNSNIGKIFSVIAQISDSEMVDNGTQRRITNFVQRVSSGLGQQKMTSLLNTLPPELRAKFNS